MGIVFSLLARCFIFTGEALSSVCLAIGEGGSLLVRGCFGVIVGICDVLAACMCCCRVPLSDRPDRDTYVFASEKLTLFNKPKNVSSSAIGDSQIQEIEEGNSKVLEETTTPVDEKKVEDVTSDSAIDSAAQEKQSKADLKIKLAQEKKARALASSEERKTRKSEEAAAKLIKKRARFSKSVVIPEEANEAASTPTEEVASTPPTSSSSSIRLMSRLFRAVTPPAATLQTVVE